MYNKSRETEAITPTFRSPYRKHIPERNLRINSQFWENQGNGEVKSRKLSEERGIDSAKWSREVQ